MKTLACALCIFFAAAPKGAAGEPPSYAKHIRPLLARYCVECHNAKALKGGLNLETFKALQEGSDKGPVFVPGSPEKSALVTSLEGNSKPAMPPKTAKLHPKAEEVALMRAWVVGGAKDDSNLVKVVIPDIKPRVPASAPVAAVAYHPKRPILALGQHKTLDMVDLTSGAVTSELQPGIITALAFNEQGSTLAIAFGEPGASGTVVLRSLEHPDAKAPVPTPLHHDAILDVAFSPDGRFLATASYDTQIKLSPLLPELGSPRILKEHSDAVYAVAFSPDSKLLASCSADRAVKVWDVASGKLLYTLGEATDWLYTLAWSPDGTRLAAGGVDKSIRVYKVGPAGGKISQSVFAHEGPVQKIVYAHDGKIIYSLGQDRVVKAWSTARMVENKTYDRLTDTGLCLAARDGALAVGRYDGVTQVLDAATGKVLHQWGLPSPRAGLQQVRAEIPLQLPPDVAKMVPAAARRGQTVRLTFAGKNLDKVHYLVTTQEGITSKIVTATATTVEADIVLPPFTPAGVYEVHLRGSTGVSKAQSLIVDLFPEVRAQDGGRSPGTGQLLKLPASVIGNLHKAGDVDFYRFHVASGQQLGVQVLTKVVGSKIDPYLQLTDEHGNVVAEATEGFLGYTFAAGGVYALGVRDRDLRGGANMHYRLHVGEIPVVTALFPLGQERGTQADISVKGVFLGADKVRVQVPASAAVGSKIRVPVPSAHGSPLGNQEVVVGEFPETLAVVQTADAHPSRMGVIPVPGTANGTLLQPGQKDDWRFTARQGQRLVLETNARRLGSSLDSILEVLDSGGNPVPRAVLRCQAKTFVTFRDHDSASPNVRIEAWGEMDVNDWIYVGGELIKIVALPTHPDADCIFFSANGKRHAYLDTTPTHHSMNEPMYKVTLHPPGTIFPPNGYPVFALPYRNDDGGPGYGRDSRILFDPPADGDYLVRVSDARGQGGQTYSYRLTVRAPRPSFTVRFTPTSPLIFRGGAVPVQIAADRLDGYEGPINVRFEDLPPGFSAPATTIEAGQTSTSLALYADEGAKTPARPQPLRLSAHAVIDGEKIVKEATGAAPKTMDPGDIVTFTEEGAVTIAPGRQAKLTVHIERRHGFVGRVPLEVRGLPHGVRVLDIGLNGILVNENEVRRTVVLYAEPWVEASSHPLVILAKREGKNTEHAAKSVLLTVQGK